jgi:NAD(P)H dehydrogenase (quinone)
MADHRATEQLLAASGVPNALLRNAYYLENYTSRLPEYLARGIVGATGTARLSAAARADLADAAAAVLAGQGHEGAVYELGGPQFTMTELADAVSAASGQTVTYTDLPVEQFQAVVIGAGVPEPVAAILGDSERGAAAGELAVDSAELEKLIGRAPTTLEQAVTAAVAALRA